MNRNEDHVILTRRHLALRERLKTSPAFGFELADVIGEDYAELVKDLKTNDCPIYSAPVRSDGYPNGRVYFYEKPGSELTRCMRCKKHTRTVGPFCSSDCQLGWEIERLAELHALEVKEAHQVASYLEEKDEATPPSVAGPISLEPELDMPWRFLRPGCRGNRRKGGRKSKPVVLTRYLVSPFIRGRRKHK